MFLFFFVFFFMFGYITGTLVFGSHMLSFWTTTMLAMLLCMSILYAFFLMSVCLYNYQYYDFCMLLMLDFCSMHLTFSCNPFHMFMLMLMNMMFCFILFYAFYYMYFDMLLGSFVYMFWTFALCMNFFMLAHDFLTAYCGWELLGLFSFFLMTYFWYRFFALKFGFKAFFMSKVGDVLLVLVFSIMFATNGYCLMTFQYINFFCVDYYYISYTMWILVLCAFTKSTQFGLHIWLPDAMEGPIPVSALMHAATLVVCGMMLVTYVYWCFDFWFSYFYNLIQWASLMLLLLSLCVFYNFDAKRYVAFSTMCQISFSMFCCLSLDMYVGCLFFCYHMLYKATLFMVLGVWMHFFFGLQDVRCYFFLYFCGCMLASLLLVFAMLNSCSLWFLCGFYCKDLLLCTLMLTSFYNVMEFVFMCVMFMLFTVVYNYFLLFFLFFVFKCFCLVDCLFLLFDFECCLLYCTLSLYLCFVCMFFMLDYMYMFMFSSYCVFWAFFLYFTDFFDMATCIMCVLMSMSFMYYGCTFFYFFNVDCIMLFWSMFMMLTTTLMLAIFCCWYFMCFSMTVSLFVWNFVMYYRYNLKYCLFFCILWSLYM